MVKLNQLSSIFLNHSGGACFFLFSICLLAISSGSVAKDADIVIAFGSCAKETEDQPVWLDIAKHQPDAFLFIGDNTYADVQEINGELKYGPVINPERFKQAYDAVNNIPQFAAFRKQVPLLMGSWDDHDYGANDAGKEYFLKAQSQAAFVEFFEFDRNHPIHNQEGIYHSKTLQKDGKSIQIIILDTRYHRDELTKNPLGRPQGKGPYIQSTKTSDTILGKAQWLWLEEQLTQVADIRIVVSSIQVVAYEHSWEGWGTMPSQRDALYNLIRKTGANGLIFLSGDRHLMEISKDEGQLGHKVPYPMWDFTSSGLNQAYSPVNEQNTFRVGKVVRDTNYGVVSVRWNKEDLMKSTIELAAFGLHQKPLEKVSFVLGELQL
jgi:alkaline phosphatase D